MKILKFNWTAKRDTFIFLWCVMLNCRFGKINFISKVHDTIKYHQFNNNNNNNNNNDDNNNVFVVSF